MSVHHICLQKYLNMEICKFGSAQIFLKEMAENLDVTGVRKTSP